MIVPLPKRQHFSTGGGWQVAGDGLYHILYLFFLLQNFSSHFSKIYKVNIGMLFMTPSWFTKRVIIWSKLLHRNTRKTSITVSNVMKLRTQCLLSLYEVVFIVDTRATTCYGCKGHVRNTASDPPPPAPHNIFLRHKEHRVFKRRCETKIRMCAISIKYEHQIGGISCDKIVAFK